MSLLSLLSLCVPASRGSAAQAPNARPDDPRFPVPGLPSPGVPRRISGLAGVSPRALGPLGYGGEIPSPAELARLGESKASSGESYSLTASTFTPLPDGWIAPKGQRHVAWGVSPRSSDFKRFLSPEGATALVSERRSAVAPSGLLGKGRQLSWG